MKNKLTIWNGPGLGLEHDKLWFVGPTDEPPVL